MNKDLTYVDIDGHELSLVHLDAEERQFVRRLNRLAAQKDWDEFDSVWPQLLQNFYASRKVPGHVIAQTTVFHIAHDLSAKLGIESGFVRPNDYESDLQQILNERFDGVHRSFCKATGLSEDMLSHVLAGRKDFSLQSLSQALEKIGYALRILPRLGTSQTPARKSTTKPPAKLTNGRKSKNKVG